MARRIKEDPEVHRNRIAGEAGRLFEKKGIQSTSMDEIAKKAGYSKATLYVYFQNKDEIIGFLVMKSMVKLKEYLNSALEEGEDFKEKYLGICKAMNTYEEEFPLYFSMVLDHINIDFEHSKCEESERETFRVGEEINLLLGAFFETGIKQGVFQEQANVKAFIFSIWGMLSGFIQLASKKEEYISQEMQMSKENFLERGFELLYGAIEKK
ncbi:transcriptional regulator, TetR family [Lachnospiraceae bacterium KM106-2]|nr:transcriptional regulator, TetR family [Lachnospiraceae bacterium KM106-2]